MKKPSRFRANFDLSVYFIADPDVCGGRDVVSVALAAVKGGATLVQLRNKTGRDFPAQARALQNSLNVPLIINDSIEIARAVGAAGVHLGQDDMNPAEARRILGPDKIIGVTAFEENHFKALDPAVIDYAGTGPVYATQTKPDKKIMGPDGLRELIALSPVPVVGIGGITAENAGAVWDAGAAGVAMMRAVSEADDPEQAARAFSAGVSLQRKAS